MRRSFNISGQKEVDLGTVLTGDDTATLGAVEVVAQKPIVKMEADKMTYSVADDSDSKTMTVLDILRKVPMVTIDGQDNISVNGSSAFKIYVDGKPNPMFSKNASQISTITWKFGNTKKQFRKHESKVGNDYIEKKNANESIGTAGGRM